MTAAHRIRRSTAAVATMIVASVVLAAVVSTARRAQDAADTGETRTLLADGRWLIVGLDVTLQDPSGRRTEAPVRLRVPRTFHTATVLPDGRILILGGRDRSGRPAAEAELIDPVSGRVDAAAIDGLPSRHGHTATIVDDRHVVIAGGVAGSAPIADVFVVDLATMKASRLGELGAPRAYHSATLLEDGRVALWGGQAADGNASGGEVIDIEGPAINQTFAPEPAAAGLYLAHSVPSDGADGVAADATIAVRFSRAVRAPVPVELIGPGGSVSVDTAVAEGGRLVFVTPKEPLAPSTSYTLTTASVRDASDPALVLGALGIRFTTAGNDPDLPTDADAEEWNPLEGGQSATWRTGRPDSPWQRLPALEAPAGVTALAGQVLRLNGAPLPQVLLEVDGHQVRTDRTGRFLIELPNGETAWEELWVDGRPASRPGKMYGTFEIAARLTKGRTSALPFTIWMPVIDTRHEVTISSPAAGALTVTTPLIPGLELRIPRGSLIRDHDGQPVTRVGITPIPLDRTPFPLPAGVDVPVYFTIQPGGAYVYGGNGAYSGARLIYPNYKNVPPGSPIEFWHYEPDDGRGWYVYGQGAVTADGRQLVPGPGVAITKFTGAMAAQPGLAPSTWPQPGNPRDGDPVDLGTGLFVMEKTDLAFPDVLPLELRRTYRQNDATNRAFGIGATHLYDIFLVGNTNPYTYMELVLPSGTRIHFDRVSPGTGYADAVYEHTSSPTGFFKARINWNGAGWDLRTKDGTLIQFPDGFLANYPAKAAARKIVDRYGNTIQLLRNSASDLTRIISPNNRWVQLKYDNFRRVTEARDNINRVVSYTYDGSGRLWKVTDPAGGVTEYTYDTSHRLLTIKDPRGIVYLTNVYDAAGRVSQQTQADGSIYQFAYTVNGSGQVTQTDVTNPRGFVRRVTFNAAGYVVSDTRAVGQPEAQTLTYEWQSATNLLLASVDALTRRTEFGYDSYANLTSTTRLAGTADAVTTSLTYEPLFQQVASVTDPLSHTTTFTHDALGSVIAVTDPLNQQTTIARDSQGRVTSITNPLNQTTTLAYAGADLARVTSPAGRTTVFTTDPAGRVVAQTDPLGRTQHWTFDGLDEVTSTRDGMGHETTFTYDGNGNLLTLTDARTKTTSWTYDSMDRVATRTDPLTRVESFQYDLNGNLASRTDRKQQVTTYQYDGLDRGTFVGFGTTAGPTYASTVTTTYDGGNRAVVIDDSAAGTIARTYDLLDRLTEEATPEGTIAYTYDAAGRRATMQVAGQPAVSYSYTNADQLVGITQGSASVTIAYDGADRRMSLTLPNGIVAEYAYDGDSRLAGLTYSLSGTPIGSLTYTYDAGGQRTGVGGTWARTGLPAALASATYDDANQIATFGGVTFTYDANGNLTNDGSKTYTWNARNELASLTGPMNGSFAYDGFGRRRAKTIGGTTTQFLYDGFNPVQELSGGAATANLLTGLGIDETFTRAEAGGTSTLLGDALGSTLELASGSGSLQTHYTYEPFGATSISGATSTSPTQFTGRENDGTGLYAYRARFYSPALQRFVSEDPIEFMGGDVNLYAYVGNLPTGFIDPLGYAQHGERRLDVHLPNGEILNKKTPVRYIDQVLREAAERGLSPKTIKSIKGLRKVIARGGAMALIFDLLFPDSIDASDCPAGPGTCKVLVPPDVWKRAPRPPKGPAHGNPLIGGRK